jgi:lysophospholipase L1-like esterase
MNALNLLFLGDSYTICEGIEPTQRWPVQWVDALRRNGLAVNEPTVIAKTGWTTGELLAAIGQQTDLNREFDLVTLLIGVNNQYRGAPIEDFRKEHQELLQFALQRTAGRADRIWGISIPDWGLSPFARERDAKKITTEVDAFNRVACRNCYQHGVGFVDLTSLTRALGSDPQWFADDGLHPSALQMERWLHRLHRKLYPALRPSEQS